MDVRGGASGVAARLDELDGLVVALSDAATDCAALAAAAVGPGADLDLVVGLAEDPAAVAAVLAGTADAAGTLCRASGRIAALAGAVAAAAASYRAQEAAVEAALVGVPLVVAGQLRSLLGAWSVLRPGTGPAAAVVAAGVLVAARPGPGRRWLQQRVVDHPEVADAAVRLLPPLLGTGDARSTARLVSRLGGVTGTLQESGVHVRPRGGPVPCGDDGAAGTGVPASGVAGLLRRGQSVASWRAPAPGGHDTLPPGAVRPERGQVRVDRVVGPEGRTAWVVHVPGTQEWDGDGRGSPMDLAANAALVGGEPNAVARGVATAMGEAGVRPGQPVLLVGHSQGGMTATALAADPRVRRWATVTAVVTAGSPLAARTPPSGVTVLAVEHTDDLVPRLDGRDAGPGRDRVVVRAPSPEGAWRTDAVPAHSSSAYVATAERVDTSDHPSLVAVRAALAPFLAREGATCTSQQFVLTRDRSAAADRR